MAQHDSLYDEVSRVAFELHVKRGRVHGCDIEDWIAAEQIVMDRYAKERQEPDIIKSSKEKKASGGVKAKTLRTSKKISESSSQSKARKKTGSCMAHTFFL